MKGRDIFLGTVIFALGYLSFLMIKPFAGYVLGAGILAFVLHPLHKRLRDEIGERFSAFSLVILAVLAALIPFLVTIGAVVDDARDLQDDIGDSDFVNISFIEQKINETTGYSVDIERKLESSLQKFASSTLGGASAFLKTFTNFFIGTALMLFLLYYMIKDGEDLVEWLRNVIPIESDIQDDYYSHLSKTTWAVVKGHVLVAVIQGLVAGLGLAFTGVPNYAFWTFVMILLGFIPVIGVILVWLPAAIYLFISGRVNMAILLVIYGFTVVGVTDNFVRPLVVDKSANLHPAAIIIGVLGGLFVFGAVGMFLGPVIIGAFKSIILVSKNS